MNPIETECRKLLKAYPAELSPLADVARRYLKYCTAIDTSAAMLIGHQPWEGPAAYALQLFPPAKDAWLTKYAKQQAIKIPPAVRTLLKTTNGCFVFGMSLYGIPPSMLGNPPMLDRSKRQCHDLATANRTWKHGYTKLEPTAFHFGGRQYSDEENTGYFLSGSRNIRSVLTSGETVGEWTEWSTFLRDECAAAEAMHRAEIPDDWWH